MQTLQNETDNLVRVMSDVMSSNEEVNSSLQACFGLLPNSNEEEVSHFMKRVFALTSLPDMERASLASTICGYLVERGFPDNAILDDLINLYIRLLDTSKPFYDMFFSQIRTIDETDEDRDNKIDQIFADLINDKETISTEVYNAVTSLDKFYAAAISLFSINKENFYEAKEKLGERVAYVGRFNQGCYWIDTLFSVLFDEQIIVIDIDKEIGFAGKINGISDNYQLQHLLMSIPLLNDGKSLISEEDLSIINGTGDQTSERSIESRWNMYNLELCSLPDWESQVKGKEKPSLSQDIQSTWIWSEGKPDDISFYDGYRIILLGKAPYSRSSKVQRTFRNLKAEIEVTRVLSAAEIDKWLNKTI
ncbi:hypothetical protein [Dysgonomonas sp. BGC7]|uniref:hypothetical protein n=1 Tax=Dysgonomonas sp. BGC7 TaxID=1658008 RepID=UPI00068154AF|nr:hypothetical protein [Dysgonomonas sp. BGC7]MBD8387498.1 hypothetical protein [Dysgonomonas sp. BGC7]